MRLTSKVFACATLATSLLGCVGDGEPDPASESSTEQDSTVVLTDCAAACENNATEDNRGQYIRLPPLSCAQPTTLVGVTLDNTLPRFGVMEINVPLWNLNVPAAQKKAECLASTLAVRVEQGPGTDVCGMKQVFYNEMHPTWSNGECVGVTMVIDADPGRYVVRALAIDGVESEHHGYDEVITSVVKFDSVANWNPIP